jgi:xanthine dehydrogenase accessory factor
MDAIFPIFERAVRTAKLVALATIVSGPGQGGRLLVWPDGRTEGTLGDRALDSMTTARAESLMYSQQSGTVQFELLDAPGLIFIDVQPPPPKLVIIGAVHIAIPLVTMAKLLGFYTIILDARSAFATPDRFAHADRLAVGWPADALPELGVDAATYFVVLTHDEKVDNPALVYACRSSARYIGALGSRRTHAKRCVALAELGLSAAETARIRAPIGLAIGARRPEEIAVSIIAEVVAALNDALPSNSL